MCEALSWCKNHRGYVTALIIMLLVKNHREPMDRNRTNGG